MIVSIKKWQDKFSKEARIYVKFDDRKQDGCYYLTGNHFQPKGTIENMTKDELNEAKRLAVKDSRWTNYSAEKPKVRYNNSYAKQLNDEALSEEWARQTRIVRGLGDTIDGGMV